MADIQKEGLVTSRIEEQAKRIPSGGFLWLAFGSIAASAYLMLSGRKVWANFVGQWAPTLLILGTYNKLVKQLGPEGYGEEQYMRGGQPSVIQPPASELGRMPQQPVT